MFLNYAVIKELTTIMQKAMYYVFVVTFIWMGMVLAISFFEAPLKFRAPGITHSMGVSIGRLIFSTLNKIEIVFCLLSLFSLTIYYKNIYVVLLIALLTVLLSIQSLLILPILNERAIQIINGDVPTTPSPHVYYVVLEVSKVVILFLLGLKQVELYKLNG